MSPPHGTFPGDRDRSGLTVTWVHKQTVPGRREKLPAPSSSSGQCLASSHASSVPLPGFGDKRRGQPGCGRTNTLPQRGWCPQGSRNPGRAGRDELCGKGALESPRGEGKRGQRLPTPRSPDKGALCKQAGSPAAARGLCYRPALPLLPGCAETGSKRLAPTAPGLLPPPICSPTGENG